jgi:hypothetical protein
MHHEASGKNKGSNDKAQGSRLRNKSHLRLNFAKNFGEIGYLNKGEGSRIGAKGALVVCDPALIFCAK